MKTLGLLGGMSWVSTLGYYSAINQGVSEALGGLHSARLVLYSVDFHDIEHLQRTGDWDGSGEQLAQAARSLERAGAEGLVLCTNTMHRVADAIERAVDMPLLHIADAAGRRLQAAGIGRVGLLGTRYTMEQDFYAARLADRFGIEVLVPPGNEREQLDRIIFAELCRGQVLADSRACCLGIMDALGRRGAQAMLLACTEIGLLVEPSHTSLPLYDTARIHAARAVEWALQG